MRYQSRLAIICLIFIAFVVKAPVAGATVCWIDHIEKADGGVRLFFLRNDNLRVPASVANQRSDYMVIAGGKVERTDADGRRTLLDYLLLNEGDKVSLGRPSSDHCTLTVVDGQERLGVLAQSSL
jgi:hypothetical protein